MSEKENLKLLKIEVSAVAGKFNTIGSLGPINNTRLIEARADLIRCIGKLQMIIHTIDKEEKSRNGK